MRDIPKTPTANIIIDEGLQRVTAELTANLTAPRFG